MTKEFFEKYKYKIKSLKDLKKLIGKHPRKRKVILCHGVFDVVHPGHIRHLAYEKTKADILVVSITTDKHIKKGIYIKLIKEQFKSKEKLIEPNVRALEIGFNYAKKNLQNRCQIKVKEGNKTKGMILTNGNNATGLGCVYAGATVCSWYPITPSTSVAEAYKKHCESFRVDAKTKKK